MIDWLTRQRTAAWLLLNVAMLLTVLIGANLHHAPFGRALYVIGMTLLCSAPLLLLAKPNGPYALLMIAMGVYYSFFVPVDLATLLGGGAYLPASGTEGRLTAAECGILLGGVCAIVGYLMGMRLLRPKQPARPAADWPISSILIVGLLIWAAGTASLVYLQVFAAPDKTDISMRQALTRLGPLLTFAVQLGRLIQPLGLLILAYGYARFRSMGWFVLIVTMVIAQVVVGFITDTKMTAILGGVLVILVKILVEGRIPKGWLAAGILFVVVAFPVFQAYRIEVTGERGLNRAQALQNIGKVLDIVLAARTKVTDDNGPNRRAQTFFERASSKENVELVFQRVGVDVPYLGAQTLAAIPLTFVPRLLLPDKVDIPVGQLFAKVFFHADSDVYISLSMLGELYWSFGWLGVVAGMTFYGLVLGAVGVRADLSESMSVTRLLLLLGTGQTLAMAFGSSIATPSINWLRTLAGIGLLHLLFARKGGVVHTGGEAKEQRGSPLVAAPAVVHYPNVLR